MKYLTTREALSRPLSHDEQLALYNGMDNLALFEINDALDEGLTPEMRETYRFEIELQAALLELEINGCLVDQTARQRLAQDYQAEGLKYSRILNLFIEAIGYFSYYLEQAKQRFAAETGVDPSLLPSSWDEWKAMPLHTRRELKKDNEQALFDFHKALKEYPLKTFNANSPSQKLRLFYDYLGHEGNLTHQELSPDFTPAYNKTRGISEVKSRKANNTFGPSTDREALEKIFDKADDPRNAAYWARPIITCCLKLSDISKTLGFLKYPLDKGYYKASFGAVTETGRLNSSENAMGFAGNFQNVTPKLRHIFVAEPGWKLCAADLEQAESRAVGAICYRLFGSTAYLNACESGDLHTLVCAMVWEDQPWPEEFGLGAVAKYGRLPDDMRKAAKKIASSIKVYRDFSMRDMAKRLGHGSNYRGQPPHMAKQTHIPLNLVQHFQSAYFSAFPEIPQWHRWVIEQVQREGYITTFLGRTRHFFGRPSEDSTIREAIAYEPQSVATGDYTNIALLNLVKESYRHLDSEGNRVFKVFLQKHDELGVAYNPEYEDLTLSQIRDKMEHPVTIVNPAGEKRIWVIPTEIETGWNLGRMSDSNPDGLSHPDPSRRRSHIPNQLLDWSH